MPGCKDSAYFTGSGDGVFQPLRSSITTSCGTIGAAAGGVAGTGSGGYLPGGTGAPAFRIALSNA